MFNDLGQHLKVRGMNRPVRLFNAKTGEYLHQAAKQRQIHAKSGLLDGFAIIRREGVDQGETVTV